MKKTYKKDKNIKTDELAPNFVQSKSINLRRKNPAQNYRFTGSWIDYNQIKEEYKFNQLLTAEDVDGYLKRANFRKTALMVTKKWSLKGPEDLVNYIKLRFKELSHNQQLPIDNLISDICMDLIRTSNAFLAKRRDVRLSTGKARIAFAGSRKRVLEPVAGYFRLDPSRLTPTYEKETGIQDGWDYRSLNGDIENFPLYNVVHFHFDKRPGKIFGTPVTLPALDDIRALRRLEENLEILVFQYIFPLFMVTVGDIENPPQMLPNGTSELDLVASQIEAMATEGGLAISGRWKIDLLQIKELLPLQEYITHFKQRIFTSLGVSGLDMGEPSTANRSTSDTLSSMIEDDVTLYQFYFENQFNHEIVNELLLESPKKINIMDEKSIVSLKFNPINTDRKIKEQNHSALMYQMNGISHSEMREMFGMHPMSEKEKKELYMHENAELMKGAEPEINKQAQTKQQPTNQFKKNPGPTKRKSSIDNNLDNSLLTLYLLLKDANIDDTNLYTAQNVIKNIYLALEKPDKISYIETLTDIAISLAHQTAPSEFISSFKKLL